MDFITWMRSLSVFPSPRGDKLQSVVVLVYSNLSAVSVPSRG